MRPLSLSRVFLLVLLLTGLPLVTPSFAADEVGVQKQTVPDERQKNFTIYDEKINNDPKMRSEFIVRMFTNGCFRHFFEQNQLISWANTYLTETPGAEGAEFLPLVGAKTGRVWTANISGGTQPLRNNQIIGGGEIVMVLEDTGACHVLGYGTDEDALHAGLKALAAELAADMKDKTVKYKFTPDAGAGDTKQDRSDVIIRWPDNKSAAYAFASTVPGGLHDHTVSITMNATFRYTE